jgi:uncharacterized protein
MRVFVTGGTGLVGSHLIEQLLARGDQPTVLTRRPDTVGARWGEQCAVIRGDPTQHGDWTHALAECDAVVNLAGENLFARRWNTAFKELLRTSRVQGTTHVARALAERPLRADGTPKVLVSASAIGYCGPRGDDELDEYAPVGSDFLARLCADWEKATQPAVHAGLRVVRLRTGVVLDPKGGALRPMLLPFKLCVGGPVGSGKQYMSWIHRDDETGLILFALDNPKVQGPLNATAPQPVTNREFSKTLGHVLHRPSFMPTPRFALRLLVGEAADVITTGQRVMPRRALGLGYVHRFPELEGALRDLLVGPTR